MTVENDYTVLEGYTQYAEYEDSEIYEINEEREIPEVTQIVMKGDTNSQYLSFQMPRYTDGIDLTTKKLYVRWYNNDNVESNGSMDDICDARYSDNYIRFAWLLDYPVTAVTGPVAFMFMATGSNEVDSNYIWKTDIGKLTIRDNMNNGPDAEDIDDDWFADLLNQVSQLYDAASTATAAADVATAAAESATTAADSANEAAEEVKKIPRIPAEGRNCRRDDGNRQDLCLCRERRRLHQRRMVLL